MKSFPARLYARRAAHHAWLLFFALSVPAAEIDPSKLPPSAEKKIDFAQDIKPILEQSCLKCHGPEKPKSKFRLDSRESALKGGENGVDIIPGQSAKSPLIHYVAGLVEDMKMPPAGKGQPLTTEQIALLRAWIDQGVAWETNPPPPNVEFAIAPTFGWTTVSGNEHVFREQTWMREGWNGGAEHFELKEKIGEHSKAFLEGHALRDDYRVALTLEREEVGFARFGAQQYRKYFSDTGGYHPAFTPSTFSLNRDLHLDIGSAWVDFGLTLPNWPRLVLGYEYQYKQGDKSTLQWGSVVQGTEPTGGPRARNILPAFKEIDEHVHILKFDLEHEIRGVRIEDSFRGEFYDSATRRTNLSFDLNGGAFTASDIKEGYRHFQGANTFRLEKQVTDWLFGSAGYLYSKLSGDASFNLDQMNVGAIVGPTQGWRTQQIILERESHVFNVNALFGPWDGLTLSAGVQSEWTRQKGLGEANLELVPAGGAPLDFAVATHSDLDKASVEERMGVRYTKIPFTALFAEVRFQQESIGQSEDEVGNPLNDFLRHTDASSDLKDFRVGFNTSPWRRMSFNAHYRHSEKDDHYNHTLDSTPDQGYSAFIRSLGRSSDEVDTKLVLHPASWLKTTLGFKWVETDYRTATDPVTLSLPGDVTPGGRLLAATYDARIYSLNFTLTPFRRLYLSSTFSYQDSLTASAANNSPSIVPYRGHVYSSLSSGTFAWSEKTDLRVSYAFSHADYGQNNFLDGLPVGMVYQRHWIQARLSRRFLKNVTGSLQYGFFLYDEPSSGRFNNYTAHAVFATMAMNWP